MDLMLVASHIFYILSSVLPYETLNLYKHSDSLENHKTRTSY